jgi:hypothetical protein
MNGVRLERRSLIRIMSFYIGRNAEHDYIPLDRILKDLMSKDRFYLT